MQMMNEDSNKRSPSSGDVNSGGGSVPAPSSNSNFYNYLRCWRCDYDDKEQCVKNFDFTKHKHEACDGKCLKAFEKVEARTKTEIDKAQSKKFAFRSQHIFISTLFYSKKKIVFFLMRQTQWSFQ